MAHADPLEHRTAHIEARRQRGLHAHPVDSADKVAVDLALPQTRSVAPDVLQKKNRENISHNFSDRGLCSYGEEAVTSKELACCLGCCHGRQGDTSFTLAGAGGATEVFRGQRQNALADLAEIWNSFVSILFYT